MTSLSAQIRSRHEMVVTQSAVAGPTSRPVQILVPVAVAVLVMLPQKFAGTVTVAFQGALVRGAKVPMSMVLSSAALPGVPLLSTTLTPMRGTLPQLVTIPLTG